MERSKERSQDEGGFLVGEVENVDTSEGLRKIGIHHIMPNLAIWLQVITAAGTFMLSK